MLRNVHIKNMALIDEIDVNFEEGLNILTGETGAGKSILLDSVMVALGGKTGKEMLREDAEYGLVELVFELREEDTRKELCDLGIDLSEEDVLIISRKLYPTYAVNKVNDERVTVKVLREIAGILIDIHSQHEHQSLLKKSNHLRILDRFGRDTVKEWKEKTAAAYEEYSRLTDELSKLCMDDETRRREIDFASYEVKEIQTANLKPGEEEDLELRYRKMLNSRQIMEAVSYVHQVSGYEQDGSAGGQLGHALNRLDQVAGYDAELKDLMEQLTTIDGLLNDFNRELSDYINSLSFEEQEFQEVEQRLDLIHNLEAKYGKTIEAVLAYLEEKEAELVKYEDYDVYKAKLEKDCERARKEYEEGATHLSKERKKLAEELTEKIREALLDLNFLDVRFEMRFEQKEQPARDGMDDAYFVISTNVGEAVKPLWEVASGGELSRIMLAVKSCLAGEDAIDTLIFDEIDVGISGRTAQKVSEKLSELSKLHQVICISHLPQIAAMADAHYKIEKSVEGQRTISHIERLQEEASIKELARMLGGVEITETVLQSAAEMKAMAKQAKK